MRIAKTIADLRLPRDKRIGFVPTMGALHEGHLQLMRRSHEESDLSVISIFVNPLQFGPNEDFSRYPRDLDADAEMAQSAGVDVVFAPEVSEVYPNRESTTISVPEVTGRWEGEHRPGHFDGVATVVAKLFHIVQPQIAFFGRKDFQQCMVIRRMIEDLNMPVELSIEPTVREKDGLAMSSRNRYLSEKDRETAAQIYRILNLIREEVLKGSVVQSELEAGREILEHHGFDIDYLAYVDNASLAPLSELAKESTLIIAARLGKTRLIDNVAVA